MKMVDKENQHKGLQFQFRKRYRKVDWKLLANVDVERIARDLDYCALQANIMNIAFCDTKSQDFIDVDEDFVKLYRLAQYTIEYLLHCQEYLSRGTVDLETKLREAIRFRNEVKEKLEAKQKDLTEVKKESRKRKKMIAVYQSMLNTSGVNGFHKCTHCEKAFVSAPFLTSHLERRHGIAAPPSLNTEDKLRIANEEQEKELGSLKDKYKELEKQLKQSQSCREQAVNTVEEQLQQEEKHKRWAREAEDRHAQEIEKVKSIYLKEASDALEEKRIAELALVEAKKGIISNLGALRDEKHEDGELRQEQRTELEEQFDLKLSHLQQEMAQQSRKLRNQEEAHRQAIEEANVREERLTKQLEDKTLAEQRLQDILNTVEIENAKLVQLNEEKPDIRSTFSRAVLAQFTNQGSAENGTNLDAVQKMLAIQPVTVLQESSKSAREIPAEKRHSPFTDKPYIKTYYEHPTEAIDAARRDLENDLAIRLLNIAATSDIDSLSTEEYVRYKENIDRNRLARNTAFQIQQLDAELTDLCQGNTSGSPCGSVSASPIPTNLPPKSPSFKQSRESLSRPNSSKRTKMTPPLASPVFQPKYDVIATSRDHLKWPSSPDLGRERLLASTPKITARSVDNISNTKQSDNRQYDLDFDDDDSDSFEKDVSEIELLEEKPVSRHVTSSRGVMATREGSRDVMATREGSRDIPVGDLESGVSDEEEDDYYAGFDYEEDDEIFEEESTQKPTGYSLRDPNYNPLDEDSDREEETRTPSPIPVVKRPHKSYSRDEDDSIFSFDGWSKMKNRNSMSADDAQQQIPTGHVAKMRQAVDELNKAKTAVGVRSGIGVAIIPPSEYNYKVNKPAATCTIDREEEDDFTVSSLSDRDVSPVGMKVDIKRNTRNGIEGML